MVDILCLPSQTFFCVGIRKDPMKRADGPVEEILMAEKWEHAKRHIENFYKTDCVLELSQEDVRGMLERMREAIPNASMQTVPSGGLLARLLGGWKHAQGPQRFFVRGTSEDGAYGNAVVSANTEADALMAASVGKPGLVPTSALSESEPSGIPQPFLARKNEPQLARLVAERSEKRKKRHKGKGRKRPIAGEAALQTEEP